MLQAALDPCKMGSVFWMHDPLYGSRAIPHPYIVISQVDARGIVLLANLTDALNTDDHACCFEAGEHPLLTKKSAVNYGEVMEAPVSTLRELNHENPGRFHRTPFSPEMVKRIQLGLLESRHAKPVFKNVVRALLESGIDDVSAEV